jgi:hypothetical protein
MGINFVGGDDAKVFERLHEDFAVVWAFRLIN